MSFDDQAHQLSMAARSSYQMLRGLSFKQRLAELKALRQAILMRKHDIVDQVCQEVGKSKTDALIAEVLGTLDWLYWLEKNAKKLLKEKKVATPITLLGKKSRLVHEPYGWVLVICPWNYPFHNAITAIAAAFIAGNSVVYKPSEYSPCYGLIESILKNCKYLQKAVHIGYGDGLLGRALIEQKPGKIFFTGSESTGSKIMAQAAQHIIPVELELGGKDPMLVFEDAQLHRAVAASLWGAFTNAGQSCSAVERLLVQESIYPSFRKLLLEEAKKLIVSNYDADGSVDIGRMSVEFQREKVITHVKDALDKGASIIHGRLPTRDTLLVEPIILENVTEYMLVWKEESFGPILPIMRFKDEAEAIEKANEGDFGLCASVFTDNKKRAYRVTRALDAGGISINNVNMSEGNPALPFGGYKKSGFGKLRGAEGLLGFTRSKAVLIDKNVRKIEANWYPYTPEKYNYFLNFISALYSSRWFRLVKVAYYGLRMEAFSQLPRLKVQAKLGQSKKDGKQGVTEYMG